jgi:cytidylate kinase
MLEAVGVPVQRLIRTGIGPVRLGDLRPGQYRELRAAEVLALRAAATRKEPGARGQGLEGTHLSPMSPGEGEEADGFSNKESHPGPSVEPDTDLRPPAPDPLIIAIDGPAAVGKSTVGTLLAERLGAVFLDTGVLYRALTWLALEERVDVRDEERLSEIARALQVRVLPPSISDGRLNDVLVNRRDVTWEIRSPEVDRHVSEVASHARVRTALIPAQRGAVVGARAVVVGRDIGTVIFPDADVKIYLEASAAERAARRARQHGAEADLESVRGALAERDALDRGRAVAPLERAADAVIVETDGVSVEEVVERVSRLVQERAHD